MKLAVVESVKEGSAISQRFDRVFVMGDSFEAFENLISLPALLDGRTAEDRDVYLDKLGKFLDVSALDKHYSPVARKLGARASEIFSLYELNIYSRHTELSDLAKASVLLQRAQNMSDAHLTSFLRKSKHINDFLKGALPRESFQLAVTATWLVRGRVHDLLRPIFEFLKGQALLAFLTLSALFAPNTKLEGLHGTNLVIEPIVRPANDPARGLSSYWKGLASLEQSFQRGLAPLHFSRGFFRSQAGKPVRHYRLRKPLEVYLSVQIAQVKVIWLRFLQILRIRLSDEEKAYFAAVRPAFHRSIYGPSFYQALWDHYQFQFFFEEASPRSVFFICEGQPWETALVLQGKRHSSATEFFGVAHTAIRPWDLRYFRPQTWDLGPLAANQSSPDILLVTSSFCYERLFSFYGSSRRLKLVETLRYIDVDLETDDARKPVIVIAMTYTARENAYLEDIAKRLDVNSTLSDMIRIRSHPLKAHDGPIQRFDPSRERASLTICDTTSTVGIELAESGRKAMFIHVGSLPNLSPLADLAEFAQDFSYMNDGLVEMVLRRVNASSSLTGFSYYSRHPDLDRWKSLIQAHLL